MKKDKRFENYILKSAGFAIPVLSHLENLVESACAEAEQDMKWGMPFFVYKGKNLCSMASFKTHCAFGFWYAAVMNDPDNILSKQEGMGQFGKITSVKDLPSDKILIRYIKEAKRVIDEGIKLPVKPKENTIDIHPQFAEALMNNVQANQVFEKFSHSHKKEYAEWINEAKTEPTRERRIATAIEWIEEGKSKEWRYKNNFK